MTQFYHNSGSGKIRAIIHPLLCQICCFCAIYQPPLRPPHRFRATKQPPLYAQRFIFSMKMPTLRTPRPHHIAYNRLKTSKFFRPIRVGTLNLIFFETFTSYCLVICGKVVPLQLHSAKSARHIAQ